jgi:hypothetical protein
MIRNAEFVATASFKAWAKAISLSGEKSVGWKMLVIALLN